MQLRSYNFEILQNDREVSVLGYPGQLTRLYNGLKQINFEVNFFEWTKNVLKGKLRGFKELRSLIKSKKMF